MAGSWLARSSGWGCWRRVGFLVDFISTPVVSGFTSATAFIVIVAQLKHLAGLRFRVRGFLNRLHALWTHIPETNPGDVILGICCIVFLLALKVPFYFIFHFEKMQWNLSNS